MFHYFQKIFFSSIVALVLLCTFISVPQKSYGDVKEFGSGAVDPGGAAFVIRVFFGGLDIFGLASRIGYQLNQSALHDGDDEHACFIAMSLRADGGLTNGSESLVSPAVSINMGLAGQGGADLAAGRPYIAASSNLFADGFADTTFDASFCEQLFTAGSTLTIQGSFAPIATYTIPDNFGSSGNHVMVINDTSATGFSLLSVTSETADFSLTNKNGATATVPAAGFVSSSEETSSTGEGTGESSENAAEMVRGCSLIRSK